MSKRSKEREAYLAGLSAFDPDNDLAPTADERGAYLATGVSPAPKVKPAQPSRRRTDYWKTVTGLMTEPEFRALGAVERCLLFELVARKDRIDRLHCKKGHTPDDIIGCSVREAANLLGLGKLHAGRAMAKLVERGFIAKAREPSKGPRRRGTSTGWRLTFLPFQGEAPTRDYVKIAARKERQSYADRVAGVPFFEPPDDDEVSHLWDRGVPPMGHLGVPRVGQVSNTDILIFSPTKSTDYEVGVPSVGHLRGESQLSVLSDAGQREAERLKEHSTKRDVAVAGSAANDEATAHLRINGQVKPLARPVGEPPALPCAGREPDGPPWLSLTARSLPIVTEALPADLFPLGEIVGSVYRFERPSKGRCSGPSLAATPAPSTSLTECLLPNGSAQTGLPSLAAAVSRVRMPLHRSDSEVSQ